MLSRPESSGWKPAPNSSMAARLPRTLISPEVGFRMPATHLRSVDLPHPLRPRMPKVSPWLISTLTSRSAQNGVNGILPPWITRSFSEVCFSL